LKTKFWAIAHIAVFWRNLLPPPSGQSSTHFTLLAMYTLYMISGFCHSVVEAFAHLGCYAVYFGSCLPVFQVNPLVPKVSKQLPTYAAQHPRSAKA